MRVYVCFGKGREVIHIFTSEVLARSQYENDPGCYDYQEAWLVLE